MMDRAIVLFCLSILLIGIHAHYPPPSKNGRCPRRIYGNERELLKCDNDYDCNGDDKCCFMPTENCRKCVSPGDCYYFGETFFVGETFPATDSFVSCTCKHGGTVTCKAGYGW